MARPFSWSGTVLLGGIKRAGGYGGGLADSAALAQEEVISWSDSSGPVSGIVREESFESDLSNEATLREANESMDMDEMLEPLNNVFIDSEEELAQSAFQQAVSYKDMMSKRKSQSYLSSIDAPASGSFLLAANPERLSIAFQVFRSMGESVE